ncbi:MAG: hypothetical protein Q9170_003988 [Blastenia crenularia]
MTGETPPLVMVQSNAEHILKVKMLGPTVRISVLRKGVPVLNDQYAMSNIKLQEATVDECILETTRVLGTRFVDRGSPLDFANYIRWHVYDTVTKMIYGKGTGMVEQGSEVNGLISEWHRVFTLGGLVASLPWLINPLIHHPLLKKLLMPSKRHNWAQDTTSAFMSAFVDHILRHPAIKERLIEEIDRFDRDGRLSVPVARYDETVAMPYFMACCRETLRLSPSVSMVLPRKVSPGGMFVGGDWIPDCTEVSANPFVLHRNREVFGEDAECFKPERWLDDTAKVRLMEKYFFAFGYGSRKCIGRYLAVFEAQKFFVQVCGLYLSQPCWTDIGVTIAVPNLRCAALRPGTVMSD